MQLRDYQLQAIQDIQNAWQQGAQNVLIALTTGAGKTVIFCDILAKHQGYSIAIAHRIELVSQISLTLARYGIRHNIIAQKNSIRSIVSTHMFELNQSFYDPNAKCYVAAVDTLLRLRPADTAWFDKISLVVQDEGHHPLKDNKWGRAANLFPKAKGLYPTATPIRADGYGLGRHADGIMDALIVGISARELIERSFLTEYRIFAPPSDLDLSQVTISASGDYSPPKLRTAVHKSHIVGDVVKHYLKIAPGKLGVTFAVDIESAQQITNEFRAAGVKAEIISSKTPDLLRSQIMDKFRKREVTQLVNVDLLGEGVDVPAIEVVSMARPTQSYALYAQQFGRALRPMEGKSHAIIIDHVGNVLRHGLPDAPKEWSLDRRDRRIRSTTNIIPLRNCLNVECMAVYEKTFRTCPYCGYYTLPANRSTPEYVDGDLSELDENVLAALRGDIKRIDGLPRVPQHLTSIAQRAVVNRHMERQSAQSELRSSIALWAGFYRDKDFDDSRIYRTFYFNFGIDVATAQTLGTKEADELKSKIDTDLLTKGVIGANKTIETADNQP